MGLDQYLYLEKYESECEWKQTKCEYPNELKELGEKIYKRDFKIKLTKYLVGYWRKFYALQDYIEKKSSEEATARGCYLELEDIEELLENLKIITKEMNENKIDDELYYSPKAYELFPPSNWYTAWKVDKEKCVDEWYKRDVEYTIELLEDVLQTAKTYDYDILYRASW